MFSFVLLISRQGRVRLAKWFSTVSSKQKQRIVLDLTSKVLARRPRMCNVIEYKDTRVIYKRYASLYFVAGLDSSDNELISLEVIHRYVEILDRYFGNVTELDLIFNFQRAYAVLDEVVLAGEMQESSKSTALRTVKEAETYELNEVLQQELTKAFF